MISAFKKFIKKMLWHDPFPEMLKNGLVVGDNFGALTDVVIDRYHCWHITIGNDVTLAPRVHILSHDASTKQHLGYTRLGKVTIGDRVFVGTSAIILPGVTIGNDVIVGAGCVVTNDIPSGVVVAGNPGQIICTLEEFIERKKAEMENTPRFDGSYHLNNGVTSEMRNEMNEKMTNGIGYIV